MSVLKYFKNIPRSPPIGRQALIVIFFFKFATRSLTKKRGHVAPPTGDRYISPGRHMPPSPLSFEPKNSGQKRGEEKKSGEALPYYVLVIYR